MASHGGPIRHRDRRRRHRRPGHRPGPDASAPRERALVVLEKEAGLGTHQTGHNSGVIHSGIYYKPAPQGAPLRRGQAAHVRLLRASTASSVDRCGKVIVATERGGAAAPADDLRARRGQRRRRLRDDRPRRELRELEPHADALAGAARRPSTGIVDYKEVLAAIEARAGSARRGDRDAAPGCSRSPTRGDGLVAGRRPGARCRPAHLVNCAGLHSDRVARLAGPTPDVQIIPFRGEYYMIRPERRSLVRDAHLPRARSRVPVPRRPLHAHHPRRASRPAPTPCLPSRARATAGTRVNPATLRARLRYRGLLGDGPAATGRRARYEMYRSLSKTRLRPRAAAPGARPRGEDLAPGGAGVRAQAVSPDGTLVDDFRIVAEGTRSTCSTRPRPAPRPRSRSAATSPAWPRRRSD